MAILQRDELEKFIELTSLKLSTDEKQALLNDLEQLLTYSDQLNTVAIHDTTESVINSNVFREDICKKSIREPLLSQSPERNDTYFVVPKIVDQDKEAA